MTLQRNAGFTLVELIVVLAIVGLSLGVAISLFGHAGRSTALNAATREIRTALRDARSTAITEDRRVVFRGDPGDGYWLDRYHVSLASNGVAPLVVAVRGGAQISFFPSGGSSGGLVLVTSGGLIREIAVDALTGRADEIR